MRGMVRVLLVLALASSCGGKGDQGGEIEHPTGANELVLRVENFGGFLPPNAALREIPSFSLYGDGRIFTAGPQIEIFPPPALPSVQVTQLSASGTRSLLFAAREAGLFVSSRRYPLPPGVGVADAGSTRFTLSAGGSKRVVEAEALGAIDEQGARKALATFRDRLFDVRNALPPGSVLGESQYRPTALRVVVLPADGAPPEPGLEQPVKDWPVAGQLAGFNQPAGLVGARCGVAGGAEFERVLRAVQQSNTLTKWRDRGAVSLIAVRPMLPDEETC